MNKRRLRGSGDALFFVSFSVRFAALIANPDTAPARAVVGPDLLAHQMTAAIGIGTAVVNRPWRSGVAVTVTVTIPRGYSRPDNGASRQPADDAGGDGTLVARPGRRGRGNRRPGDRAGSGKSGKSFHHVA